MYRFRDHAALLLLMAGLTLALAACSGGTDSGDGSSGDQPATYTNDEYGFSITVDPRFTEGEPATQVTTGEAVFSTVFADKDGARVGDSYVDAVQVSVYELAREVEAKEVPGLKQEVQGVVDQLLASSPSAEVVAPLEEVTVNGLPGFGLTYTYSQDGTEMTAVSFFLFQGKYEYQITAQAASENWDALKGKFEGAVQTFKAQ